MLECLIIGDTIATNLSQYKTNCAVITQPGISSHDWVENNLTLLYPSELTIISLGSYDELDVNTRWKLYEIRERIKTGKVVWIVPVNKIYISNLVKVIAAEYNDSVLPISKKQISKDGIQPSTSGYRDLANKLK